MSTNHVVHTESWDEYALLRDFRTLNATGRHNLLAVARSYALYDAFTASSNAQPGTKEHDAECIITPLHAKVDYL